MTGVPHFERAIVFADVEQQLLVTGWAEMAIKGSISQPVRIT